MKKRALFLCELADILLRSVSALVLSFAATLPAFLSIGKMGGGNFEIPFFTTGKAGTIFIAPALSCACA